MPLADAQPKPNPVIEWMRSQVARIPESENTFSILNMARGGANTALNWLDATNRALQGYDPRGALEQGDVLAPLGLGAMVAPFSPKNAVGIFGGRLAKTADHAALARAEEMAAKGASREDIWRETGWFQGRDGKWRFEIDDRGLRVERGEGESLESGPVVHELLAAAYPEQHRMILTRVGFWPERRGAYGRPDEDDPYHIVEAFAPTAKGRRSVAGHELQHFVQNVEGFSAGQPGTAFPLYKPWKYPEYRRNYREVEARNVQKRMDMTPEERRATPPWVTQDVPDERQIVRLLADQSRSSLPGTVINADQDRRRIFLIPLGAPQF